jgi:hypothetical protein
VLLISTWWRRVRLGIDDFVYVDMRDEVGNMNELVRSPVVFLVFV